MSHDIFLQFAQRIPLWDDTSVLEKVEQVVRAFGGGNRDEYGYFFNMADGTHIEMYCGDKPDSAMLAVRGSLMPTLQFVFALMKATGWVTFAGDQAISLTRLAPEEVHEGFPPMRVVSTEEELAASVFPGFAEWAGYRDQIVRGV